MNPLRITITPEQQAGMRERLTEAVQPIIQMREQLRQLSLDTPLSAPVRIVVDGGTRHHP